MRLCDSNRTKGNGFNVQRGDLVQPLRNTLPKEVLCATSVEAFKVRMDGILGSLIQWLAALHMAGAWNQVLFESPSNISLIIE